MKIFGKEKKTTKSNSRESETELVALVTRIAERLDVLEKKMDQVIGQTSSRSLDRGGHGRPASHPVVPSQPCRQSVPLARPQEVKAASASHPQGHPHGRREKIMHKAVCADCQKDCEIPFKPTGERPVYCKECFSKRKSHKPQRTDPASQPPAPFVPETPKPADLPQRQVSVTKKNGVGKVTVTEIVQPSARAASPKKKSPAPEKRSRK